MGRDWALHPVASFRRVRVAFVFVLALVTLPGLLGTATASAQRGPAESDPVVIESVCVSRPTGAVRDAAYGCSSFEVLVTLPGDPPAGFCASNYTGVLRYISTHETAVSLDSASDATVCVNRYTRALREASRTGTCQSHETVALLGSGVAPQSCVINEIEPNQDPETAMDLESYGWCLDNNPYITNPRTVPHITINGTGDGTFDTYKFVIPEAGTTATFDIDFGWTSPCETSEDPCDDFDSLVRIGTEAFPLASNNDGDLLDPGSEDSYYNDSLLEYTFDEPGVYYLQVFDNFYGRIRDGDTYQLHVSIEGHSVP